MDLKLEDLEPEDLMRDFDGAMRTLERAVGSDDPDERRAIVRVLHFTNLADVQDPPRTVRLLERFLLERPDDHDDVPQFSLEFWLNRSAATPELRPRLEALAIRQIYRGSLGELRSMLHVVGMDDPDRGGEGEEDPGLRAMRERLLRAMLVSSRDTLSGLPDVIVNDRASGRWTIDVLLDAPNAAWRLMEPGLALSAENHDWFANPLADEMRRRDYRPDDPRLRRLL